MAERKLTPKQEIFVREYLIDFNATQAAIRAGYSPQTAQEQSSRLLSNVIVSQEIKALLEKKKAAIEVTAELVLGELLKLAKVDIADFYEADGKLKNIHDIPEYARKALHGIEVEELFEGFGKEREKIGYTKKIKTYDKTKALELLGRYLKLFTDKLEHSGTITLEDLVAGSNKEGEK